MDTLLKASFADPGLEKKLKIPASPWDK